VATFSRRSPYEKRRSLMTGRRNDAVGRWAVIAVAALLLLGVLVLGGCALDPDGGASITVAREYAPTPVKVNVLESMKSQGFSISNYMYTYVTYPSVANTATVFVTGLMYGPSGQKDVLDIYKALKLTVNDKGFWKVDQAVKGVPPKDEIGPSEEASGTESVESSASGETTTN
jgi:hypothetical protein